ncbi:MAG: response regulator transcription factor [Dehalococcoidia bacterium]|nr:response regulator transcription factor [Dehalococcoidia bacterium]
MQPTTSTHSPGLPPLVGKRVVVISLGLERSHDRARGLEEFGYRVSPLGDPAGQALGASLDQADAIVIDLGRDLAFPGDVVARVRADSPAPVVVVGCAGTFAEMLRCYEAGADDYCRPKSATEEIDLRLRAMFRRMEMAAPEDRRQGLPAVLRVGSIEIDPASQTVTKNGVLVALSPTEFRLLATLAEHPGEVIPSKALIARVWGNQYAGETHYLRLYVRYLRQKLEDDPSNPVYIVNRWGSGYSLDEPRRAAARAG